MIPIRAETPEFIPGEYVLLTVSDTGAGMSQEVRENIFEPFFTTKEVGKGTGLGLSTVYGIVKQNEGFIYVASEPGEGTTFKIYLPSVEAESAQDRPEGVAGKPPTGTETILVVEDDEAILNLSKIILENLGYTVLAAHTPAHAIRIVEDHPGDLHLLITDVVMPEMNGRDLAKQLSAIRPNLKCLYMSGYTADVIAHRGILEEGVNFIQNLSVAMIWRQKSDKCWTILNRCQEIESTFLSSVALCGAPLRIFPFLEHTWIFISDCRFV